MIRFAYISKRVRCYFGGSSRSARVLYQTPIGKWTCLSNSVPSGLQQTFLVCLLKFMKIETTQTSSSEGFFLKDLYKIFKSQAGTYTAVLASQLPLMMSEHLSVCINFLKSAIPTALVKEHPLHMHCKWVSYILWNVHKYMTEIINIIFKHVDLSRRILHIRVIHKLLTDRPQQYYSF